VPFSAPAAAAADRGQPVMVTRSVPEQVRVYEQVAGQVDQAMSEASG
jgi:hypothetical protein